MGKASDLNEEAHTEKQPEISPLIFNLRHFEKTSSKKIFFYIVTQARVCWRLRSLDVLILKIRLPNLDQNFKIVESPSNPRRQKQCFLKDISISTIELKTFFELLHIHSEAYQNQIKFSSNFFRDSRHELFRWKAQSFRCHKEHVYDQKNIF